MSLWLPLALFILLTVILALRHDMWRDEVRAFSVAIQAPSWPALVDALEQEGHPILWYAILRIGYALTGSALVMPVVSLVVAGGAAYLILRFAPFPLRVRLLIVFGAFLAHEYSVVARNYGIGVLLMITACVLYPIRKEKRLALGATLFLLAQTSVHAAAAAGILTILWSTDALGHSSRRSFLNAATLVTVGVAIIGTGLALVTAQPSADMVYSFSFASLDPGEVVRSLLKDPGLGLKGTNGANIAAFGELPWYRLGLPADVVSRIMVDIALLAVAWGLRGNRPALAVLVISVLLFEFLFRNVYGGALRHHGMLFFLVVSICWIAYDQASADATARRSISIGLLPLVAAQALVLPVIAVRHFQKPESMSGSFARLIQSDARYHDAILMSEPDYMMESMPYYLRNPVFMARQNEFHHRVYFDRGSRRRVLMTLGELTAAADSLSCATGRKVLMPIAHKELQSRDRGEAKLTYGALFRWDPGERQRFLSRARQLRALPGAISDENYTVYEIDCERVKR